MNKQKKMPKEFVKQMEKQFPNGATITPAKKTQKTVKPTKKPVKTGK